MKLSAVSKNELATSPSYKSIVGHCVSLRAFPAVFGGLLFETNIWTPLLSSPELSRIFVLRLQKSGEKRLSSISSTTSGTWSGSRVRVRLGWSRSPSFASCSPLGHVRLLSFSPRKNGRSGLGHEGARVGWTAHRRALGWRSGLGYRVGGRSCLNGRDGGTGEHRHRSRVPAEPWRGRGGVRW